MIWIIDDDAYMLKLLAYKIQKLGHTVSSFDTAEDAIMTALPADLTHVFTDIHLNGKSGFELAQTLKDNGCSSLFIALTSDDLSENASARELFDHIFQKPLSNVDLNSVFAEEFDFPYLNAMIESEEDKIEIIRHFHEETTRDNQELKSAVINCDKEVMLLLSHRLSGRLAQFSQEEISLGFRSAEEQLLEGNCNNAELEAVIGKLEVFLVKLSKTLL